MPEESLALPLELVQAHAAGFDYRGGDGVDFEPYESFLSAAETARWWRAWTGNKAEDGSAFRVFGQDGTGVRIAERYAPSARREVADVVTAARAAFPDFAALVDRACR